MDQRTADRRLRDSGVTSVQFVFASVLALVVFLALANIVVVQFTRGAMRSALDQGVRVGAIHQSTTVCEARIAAVLGDLLAGEIGDTIGFGCSIDGGLMTATVSGVVDSWTPFATEFDLSLVAEAVLESNGT